MNNFDIIPLEDCANILNVSVPYILELIAQEKLNPFSLDDMSFDRNDVYTFKDMADMQAHKALDEITRINQELGLYDD